MAEEMTQDTPVQDIPEQDIPLAPTFGETLKSAFWRTPSASLLYQPLLAEKAFPSDTTPIDDADIEKRIREEGLVDYVDSFTHITTQGELEAQVSKIRHERKNDAIAAASGWTGFAVDLVAGAVDPLSIATFKAASAMNVVRAGMASKSFATRAGTVAAEGAAGGAVAAGALAAGNETTTLADAPGMIAGSAVLPVALYGGGSLARKMLGKAADALTPKQLDELGEGLKKDLAKFEPKTPASFKYEPPDADLTSNIDLGDYAIRHVYDPERGGRVSLTNPAEAIGESSLGTHKFGDTELLVTAQTNPNRSNPHVVLWDHDANSGQWHRVGVVVKSADGGIEHLVVSPHMRRKGLGTFLLERAEDVLDANPFKAKDLSQDGAATINALRRSRVKAIEADTRPDIETEPERMVSEFAKRIEDWQNDKLDLNDADAKTVMAYNGRNTVDAYELSNYKLAKSWAGDKVAKYSLRMGFLSRGAPAVELATSSLPAARRANALLNFTKGALDDTTNTATFYTKMETGPNADRNRFVRSATGHFKSWRKKNVGTPNVRLPMVGGVATDALASAGRVVRSRVTGDNFDESTFHDLVYRAMVYGDEVQNLPKPLREKLMDPDVQAAAKDFRKFDEQMGDRVVRSGLMRRDRLMGSHIGRNYNRDAVSYDFEKFVQSEADAAYNHEWGTRTRLANEKEASDTKLETEDYQKRREKLLKEHDEATPEYIAKEVKKFRDTAKTERDAALEKATNIADTAADAKEIELHAESDAWLLRKTVALNRRAKREKWDDADLRAAEEDLKADASDRFNQRMTEAMSVITRAYDRAKDRAVVRYKKAVNRAETEIRSGAKKDRKAERTDLEDSLELAHQKTIIEIRAERAKTLSEANRIEVLRWSGQHAEGVMQAITTGQTGTRAAERSAGNQRGSRIERNVYMTDRQLLDNGWLDTDLFKVVDKATRIDGADSVLATLFRKPLTEEQIRMAESDHPDAYWAHGDDPLSMPDLDMSVPIHEIRMQGEELRRSGQKSIDREVERAIENLEISRDLARGALRWGSNSVGRAARSALALWKAAQFSYLMGRSVITNVSDLGKFIHTHGFREPLKFAFTRMAENLRDTLEGRAGFTREQLRETMRDCNVGMDEFSFARVSGWLDIMDPWSAQASGNKVDQFAAKLTHMGSKAFLLHAWNNMVTRTAGGIGMNRMVRLAHADGPMSPRDAEWAKYVGLTEKDLKLLRNELNAQGINKFENYKTHVVDPDLLSEEMRSKFLNALVREVRTTVVTPNAANLPMFMQNPVLNAMMQFRSFSFEAQTSVNLRSGQIAASGDYSLAAQGLIAMMTMAYASYLLKGVAESVLDGALSGDKKKQQMLEKKLNAHRDNLGSLLYEVMDYGSVSPLLFTYNNMVEDAFGFGLKDHMQRFFKDKNPRGLASSSRSQSEGEFGTLMGPGYRTGRRMGSIAKDFRDSWYGKPRSVDRSTVRNMMHLVPYSGTFYLRGVTEQATDAITYGLGLPKK